MPSPALPLRGGGSRTPFSPALRGGVDPSPSQGEGRGGGSIAAPSSPCASTSTLCQLRPVANVTGLCPMDRLVSTATSSPPSIRSAAHPIDMLIVRENTEGLYAGRERREGDTAIAERVITRHASERIARVAFEQARRRGASRNPSLTIHDPQSTISNLRYDCAQSKCSQAHRRALSRSVSRRRKGISGRDHE